MTFAAAVQSGLKNWINFKGLASRAEYWYFQLFLLLVLIVTNTFDALMFPIDPKATMVEQFFAAPASLISSVLLMLPSLAMQGRRLRDAGFSAKWLWLLVPASAFISLVALAQDAVLQMDQDGTVEGTLNVMGYAYPAAMICSGIAIFFFVITLQPSKSGAKGNRYAPDYDPTKDPKSDDYAGSSEDWEPKL